MYGMGLFLLPSDILWLLHPGLTAAGAILDALIPDPYRLPHPVQLMGAFISLLDRLFLGKKDGGSVKGKKENEKSKSGGRKLYEFLAGLCLSVLLMALSAAIPLLLLYFCALYLPWLFWFLYVFMVWQILAAGSMAREAKKIEKKLLVKDLPGARKALSGIVGRDTDQLSKEDVVRACVESVAESASDGVFNPLLYLCLFGPVGGFVFKAVNTMDSMIGYHSTRYEYFGKTGARLDDLLGFIPSRIGGLLMLIAGKLFMEKHEKSNRYSIFHARICAASGPNCTDPAGESASANSPEAAASRHLGKSREGGFPRNASAPPKRSGFFSDWNRFRRLPTSPNAGQTEAAMALSLGIRLGGTAYYGGIPIDRPRLGHEDREPETADISRSVRLMLLTEAFCFLCFAALGTALGFGVYYLVH